MVPILGSMETDVAPVTAQFNVADCPDVMDEELASNIVTTGGLNQLKTAPFVK